MVEITLDSTAQSISRAKDFVEGTIEQLGLPLKLQLQMSIVVDEILSNIVHYAFDSEVGEVKVQLDYDDTDAQLTMRFIDTGMPFDPRQADEPDISLSLEERPIGGLGLFMVKQMVDTMDYERTDDRNVLTLRKHV